MEEIGQDELNSAAPPTYGGTALLLQYSYLRSSWIVSKALAETFPTEQLWLDALNESELQESLGSFGQLLEEIQQELAVIPDPEALLKFGEQHYARSLECVEAFAARIGVTPMDLLLVSINNL
jgi:hypothetical protein